MKKLVYGVGENDASYVVQPTIDGVRVRCPFYVVWADMLKRCYSGEFHQKYPSYLGCKVKHDRYWSSL